MSSATVACDSQCCQRKQRFQSASTDVDSQTPDEFGLAPQAETRPASETGLVPAPIVQVKNTFIYLQDEDSTPPCVRPRSKTFDCRLLSCIDGGGDDEAEADSTGPEDEWPEELACSTPTPRASADLGFAVCQNVAVPRAPVPVLLPVFWPLAAPAGELPLPLQGCGSAPPQGDGPPVTLDCAPQLPSCPREWLEASLSSTADGSSRIQWTVDARKFWGTDKQLVSSTFDVDLGLGVGPAVFRVMLVTSGGTASFRKTGGVGCVQVKCACEGCPCLRPGPVRLRVSIGRGGRQSPPRGPFVHSFSDSPVFTLPRQQAEWDFRAAADEQSMTLVVNVDIASMDEA
jgi:hypothetical protein